MKCRSRRTRRGRLTTFACCVLIPLLLVSCGGRARTRVLKLGHGLEPTHSVHRGMVFMADRVAELSGGRMRIDVYPSQQLGSERELIELLQIGSVGMTKVSAAVLESFVPAFRVYGIPYLFADQAHRDRVLQGDVGKELLRATGPARVLGLAYYDSGTRSFYTTSRPVRSPDDLAGLKIRTQESATAVQMVQALGGSATPIAWGELYTALQQGVVDGAENNPPSFYLSRHYEVCKYYSLDEHTSIPDVLLISTSVWNGLDDEERRWLQEAADESFIYQSKLWQESTADSLRSLREAGVEIIRPDIAPFVERVQSMHREFRRDPEISRLMDRIAALGAGTEP